MVQRHKKDRQRLREKLRRLIAEGARLHAARDIQLAREWFTLDEEAELQRSSSRSVNRKKTLPHRNERSSPSW